MKKSWDDLIAQLIDRPQKSRGIWAGLRREYARERDGDIFALLGSADDYIVTEAILLVSELPGALSSTFQDELVCISMSGRGATARLAYQHIYTTIFPGYGDPQSSQFELLEARDQIVRDDATVRLKTVIQDASPDRILDAVACLRTACAHTIGVSLVLRTVDVGAITLTSRLLRQYAKLAGAVS